MEDEIGIDMLFFSNEKYKPTKTTKTGMPVNVYVAVTCDNGAEYMGMDRYDLESKSWLDNYEKEGKHVVAWAYPPCVSNFQMKNQKTNKIKEPTLEEIAELVTFGRDGNGKLFVDRVGKAKNVDEADWVLRTRRVSKAKFVDEAGWVKKTGRVDEAKQVKHAIRVKNADQVDEVGRVDKAKWVCEVGRVDEAGWVGKAKTVEKADRVDDANWVVKAEKVDEADRVNEARRVNRAGVVGKVWQAHWVLDAKTVEYSGEIITPKN